MKMRALKAGNCLLGPLQRTAWFLTLTFRAEVFYTAERAHLDLVVLFRRISWIFSYSCREEFRSRFFLFLQSRLLESTTCPITSYSSRVGFLDPLYGFPVGSYCSRVEYLNLLHSCPVGSYSFRVDCWTHWLPRWLVSLQCPVGS